MGEAMTIDELIAVLPEKPKDIERIGAARVYKGVKYTVYDDGNSAETPYQTDLAEYEGARARLATLAMRQYTDAVVALHGVTRPQDEANESWFARVRELASKCDTALSDLRRVLKILETP